MILQWSCNESPLLKVFSFLFFHKKKLSCYCDTNLDIMLTNCTPSVHVHLCVEKDKFFKLHKRLGLSYCALQHYWRLQNWREELQGKYGVVLGWIKFNLKYYAVHKSTLLKLRVQLSLNWQELETTILLLYSTKKSRWGENHMWSSRNSALVLLPNFFSFFCFFQSLLLC